MIVYVNIAGSLRAARISDEVAEARNIRGGDEFTADEYDALRVLSFSIHTAHGIAEAVADHRFAQGGER